VEILQPGYRIGERVLRPARVAVAEPDPDAENNAEKDAEKDAGFEPVAQEAGTDQPADGQDQ
jgi:molecular chaperone GrpE